MVPDKALYSKNTNTVFIFLSDLSQHYDFGEDEQFAVSISHLSSFI